jgi:hypothetical protein
MRGVTALLAPLAQSTAADRYRGLPSPARRKRAAHDPARPRQPSRSHRPWTVIAKDDTTVSAGGGALPATRYRIRVSETLKGQAASGDVIEVRLLAALKAVSADGVRRGPVFRGRAASVLRFYRWHVHGRR